MYDIMLFGDGWAGEVRQIEPGQRQFRYIPSRQDPHLREVLFTVTEYVAEDGDIYLVGCSGHDPAAPDIQEAVFRYNPTPV